MLALIRKYFRREDGTSTIEFVIILPVIMMLITSAVETGVLMTRFIMLERGLDIAVRDIRLGASPSVDDLVDDICDSARILPECQTSLIIDMQVVDENTWALPDPGAPCYNREEDIEPVTTFQYGTENEIMLIRACVIVDPLMPGAGFGEAMDNMSDGQFYITAASAFVNEPD